MQRLILACIQKRVERFNILAIRRVSLVVIIKIVHSLTREKSGDLTIRTSADCKSFLLMCTDCEEFDLVEKYNIC